MKANSLRHLPNIISVLRMVLIIPIIGSIWDENYLLSLILIFIAGVSDAVDGFLARYFNWQSRLGGFLDPLADKALLISLFIVFSLKGLLPFWLMYLVVGRDIIILVGATACQLITRRLEMRPMFMSKINTALQIILVVLVAIKLANIHVAPWLLNGMMILVVISTLLSGIAYIIRWTRYTLSNIRQ